MADSKTPRRYQVLTATPPVDNFEQITSAYESIINAPSIDELKQQKNIKNGDYVACRNGDVALYQHRDASIDKLAAKAVKISVNAQNINAVWGVVRYVMEKHNLPLATVTKLESEAYHKKDATSTGEILLFCENERYEGFLKPALREAGNLLKKYGVKLAYTETPMSSKSFGSAPYFTIHAEKAVPAKFPVRFEELEKNDRALADLDGLNLVIDKKNGVFAVSVAKSDNETKNSHAMAVLREFGGKTSEFSEDVITFKGEGVAVKVRSALERILRAAGIFRSDDEGQTGKLSGLSKNDEKRKPEIEAVKNIWRALGYEATVTHENHPAQMKVIPFRPQTAESTAPAAKPVLNLQEQIRDGVRAAHIRRPG